MERVITRISLPWLFVGLYLLLIHIILFSRLSSMSGNVNLSLKANLNTFVTFDKKINNFWLRIRLWMLLWIKIKSFISEIVIVAEYTSY